jgi:hypothetical protein
MKEFKYSLSKKGKWVCPRCGKKTFVCYVDENGNVLDESVGKCDRADKCAHHYPPREYFKDNNLQAPRPTTVVKPSLPAYVPPSHIDTQLFKRSVLGTETNTNHLVLYLGSKFDAETVKQMKHDYYIGTSKHWPGATVFWQVDRFGHIHAGKIMLYNPVTGKRVKDPFPHVTWVHTALKLPNFNLKQCLFGEHLLHKYPDMSVAIVESEKTAIILGGVLGDCIAVACGGCGNLTPAMCEPLRNRDVILFPDNGQYYEWAKKGLSLAHLFKGLRVSSFMEKLPDWMHAGDDIADYIVREYMDWTQRYDGIVPLDLDLIRLK